MEVLLVAAQHAQPFNIKSSPLSPVIRVSQDLYCRVCCSSVVRAWRGRLRGWQVCLNLAPPAVPLPTPSRPLPCPPLLTLFNFYSVPVYSFPTVYVRNYQKLGGFKQEKFIVSQFWRQKSQTKQSAGLVPCGASPSVPVSWPLVRLARLGPLA